MAITGIQALTFMNISGQTNIGFSIGMDLGIVNTRYINGAKDFSQTDIGYNKNPLFGLRIERQVSKSCFLALQGDYCMKEFDTYDRGIAPQTGFKYPKYGLGLSVNWLPVQYFSIGIGPEYYRTPREYSLRSYSVNTLSNVVRQRMGGLLAIHFFYRQFLIDLNYHQGVKIQRENGFNSFNLSLCYMVKMRKNKKERGNRF